VQREFDVDRNAIRLLAGYREIDARIGRDSAVSGMKQ
jgi:hypothetical protein